MDGEGDKKGDELGLDRPYLCPFLHHRDVFQPSEQLDNRDNVDQDEESVDPEVNAEDHPRIDITFLEEENEEGAKIADKDAQLNHVVHFDFALNPSLGLWWLVWLGRNQECEGLAYVVDRGGNKCEEPYEGYRGQISRNMKVLWVILELED